MSLMQSVAMTGTGRIKDLAGMSTDRLSSVVPSNYLLCLRTEVGAPAMVYAPVSIRRKG